MAVMSLLWGIALAFAFARVASTQLAQERDLADIRALDRRYRASARTVRIVGKPGTMVPLGIGDRAIQIFDLTSLAFDLCTEDGEIVHVAEGAKLRAILSGGSLQGNVLRVPAGIELLCRLPALVGASPDGVVVMRGELVTLFDPAVDLFAFVRYTRVASRWGIACILGVTLTIIVMAARHAPNTLWNVPLVLLLAILVIDQLVLRGTLFAVLCTRWRDPSAIDD